MNRKTSSFIAVLGGIPLFTLAFILWSEPNHGLQQRKAPATNAPSAHLMGQSVTLLPDGRELLLGGEGPNGPVASAEIENLQTGALTPLGKDMPQARAWHTATVLPDGNVLVFGGVGSGGHVVNTAELFDPSTRQFKDMPSLGVTPRSHHTATLLTDGTVFFAGGVNDEGQTLGSAQIWDPRENTTADVPHWLFTPRSDQTAKLQSDGKVLLWGGKDATGLIIKSGEVYDPATQSFMFQPSQPPPSSSSTQVAATIPEDTSRDVPSNVLIGIRFTLPVQAKSVSSSTVTLSGPEGNVAAKAVSTDGGMLAFVTPKEDLTAGTDYTVDLNGLNAATGQKISEFSFDFTTSGNGLGLPTSVNWSGGPQNSPYLRLPPLHAPPGTTAIAGQVLLQDGLPVKKVTMRVGASVTTTDGTGRFILTNVPSGRDVLIIDGRTASTKKITYGVFKDGVDVTSGETQVLGYTIWMPVIDTADAVTIPAPTSQETVITTPLIPGLELHLPAGTTITDIDDKVVNQVSITPIPVSQPPFPLPHVKVPVYFTIQPGGGWIWVNKDSSGPDGGWLIYPNTEHKKPGSRYDFWNYDAKKKGWYIYGHGSVTPDGNSVKPDPGVLIYELTGAMVGGPALAPSSGPSTSGDQGGEPVDLGTGLFVYRKVDLYEPGFIPIVLTRTYRPQDNAQRDFGIGTQNPYDIYLVGDYTNYSYFDLVLPSGSEIYFQRTSPGTGYADGVFQASSNAGPWFGATIVWNGDGWTLTRRDGTVYEFPAGPNASTYQQIGVTIIEDRNGNTQYVSRDSNYNITEVSDSGTNNFWIKFTYDSSNRVTQAQDALGRTVSYSYDANGRLSQVTDANNGVWKYYYDSNNNMTSIIDPRNITYLTNQYDSSNRVIKQTQADNGTYMFNYTTDGSGNITETDVTDPNGNVRKVAFNTPPTNPSGFITGGSSSSVTYAYGTPQAATYTKSYQTGTDLLTSVTDPLGRVTSYTYDAAGDTTSITRLSGTPNAVTTRFTYDPTYNQVTTVTDPLGLVTNFLHDSKGNLISIVDPMGKATTFTVDPFGRIQAMTDPANETTTFAYSSVNYGPLPTSLTDPLNRKTAFSYDSAGRMLSMTSPMNHLTQYAYNPLNEITSITDAMNGVTSFTYDEDGNLLTVTDPQNTQNPTTYTYNSMNEVATRKDPLGITESLQYDGNGNLTQFTDRRGLVTTYNYDALNRLTFIGYGTQAGPTYASTINYTYDSGNRLTQAVDSISGTFMRSYDGLDRLTQEQGPEGTVGYTYDVDGRRTQMTVSNQSNSVDYTYDNDSHLIRINQGSSNVSFTYDTVNRRTSMTLPNGIVAGYSYDAGSELTGISYQLAGAMLGNLTYSYDDDGRRTAMGGTWARMSLPSPTSSSAVYNAANELTQWNGVNLTYDANGNLTGDGLNNYTWNERNELSTVKDANTGATLASLVYDPFRRRLQNSAGDQMLYDGQNAVQELSGSTPVVNRLTGGVDEFFARTDSAGTTFPLTDAIGSTIALTDSSGTVQTQYTYDPFGGSTSSGAMSTNTYQFTGRANDGTGLYFYRARYYSPRFQRFISEDPLGFTASRNIYAYAANNPISLGDPLGLSDIVVTVTRTVTTSTSTMGTMTVSVNGKAEFGGYSLERAATRIAPGEYPAEVYASPHFRGMEVLRLEGVPAHNGIEIHPGNTYHDSRGCILPGTSQRRNFVRNSRDAFNDIIRIVNSTIQSDLSHMEPTTIRVNIR